MKKIFSFLILIIIVVSIVSCGKKENRVNRFFIGGTAIIYENTLYYVDSKTQSIRYQNIKSPREEGLRLIGDALEDGSADPLWCSSARITIDENATINNDGYHVLVMWIKSAEKSRIVSFDTKNGKIKIIKDDVAFPNVFAIYGDSILFTTQDGDKGNNLNVVKTDGSNHRVLDNPENNVNMLRGCYNDRIYYSVGASLFKTDFLFEKTEHISNDFSTPLFFFDDNMFFKEMSSGRIIKVNINNISSKESVLNDAFGTKNNEGKYIYQLSNETDKKVFYMYDARTNQEKEVYKNDNNTVSSLDCIGFDGKKILFNAVKTDGTKGFIVFDINTGDEIHISVK